MRSSSFRNAFPLLARILLAGRGTRTAAIILAIFTLAASVFFHADWAAPADQAFVAQLLFFKNIGLVGGLLALAAVGAGRWNIDARRTARD